MNRTVLIFKLMTNRHSTISFHNHTSTEVVRSLYWFDGFSGQPQAPSLLIHDHLHILHPLLFQKCLTAKGFYQKSPKELLTRSFTTTISSLEERETHYISHFTMYFPLPSTGYSILHITTTVVGNTALSSDTLSDRPNEALLDQQWALRDRYQSGTVGSTYIFLQINIMGF